MMKYIIIVLEWYTIIIKANYEIDCPKKRKLCKKKVQSIYMYDLKNNVCLFSKETMFVNKYFTYFKFTYLYS